MQFLDELASNIFNVVSRKQTIVLVRGYNINYFKDVEKQSLQTILTPYSLEVQNKNSNSCQWNTFIRSIIDYMIAGNFTVNGTIVFDNAIFGDHFVNLDFLNYKKNQQAAYHNKNVLW